MAIYQLPESNIFPHPSLSEEDGLLAVGGDLSPERILTAYSMGIFPWFGPEDPILWWSPDPRCVLFPSEFKPSKSLRLLLQKNIFEIRFDTDFSGVIKNCASVVRSDEAGTWISPEIIEAYSSLHKMGFAHSVETYLDGKLVGGLYGVSVGNVFCGESMFFSISNASKVAFCFLVEKLKELKYKLLDNQMTTPHLLSLGAKEISRDHYLEILEKSKTKNLDPIKW